MKIETAKVHPYAIEELACKVIGLDYDEIDANTTLIDERLFECLEVDLHQFQKIVERLLPLIMVGKSVITKTTYKGFADVENSLWLTKIEVPEK